MNVLRLEPFRSARYFIKRQSLARKWGVDCLKATPWILGNSMAKAGSHLLIQVLRGICSVGPFCIARIPHIHRKGDIRFPPGRVVTNLKHLKPGDIAFSKIPALPEYIKAATEPGSAAIYLYRDPRDVIVSHIFYVTEMNREHPFSMFVLNGFKDMEDRIDLFIQGNTSGKGPRIPGLLNAYRSYQGWLDCSSIFHVRYEDLILHRSEALTEMLNYLRQRGGRISFSNEEAVRLIEQAIAPRRSTTYRRGTPGNWREHFTERNKAVFKESTGSLLVDLGYEQDMNW